MENSKIRIGKDFNVFWTIYKIVDGQRQPYNLVGKELQLYYRTSYGRVEAKDWKVNDNVIAWTFFGKEQKYIGNYELILVENAGQEGMVTVDTCNAFSLVAHSCEEYMNEAENIVVEAVTTESEVALAPVVKEIGGGASEEDIQKIKNDIAELQQKDVQTDNKLTELSAEVNEVSEVITGVVQSSITTEGWTLVPLDKPIPQGATITEVVVENGTMPSDGTIYVQTSQGTDMSFKVSALPFLLTYDIAKMTIGNVIGAKVTLTWESPEGGVSKQISELSALTDNLSSVVNGIEQTLQKGDKADINLEVWYDGEYVSFDTHDLTTNSAYDVFKPIFLKKGDTLVYKSLCTQSSSELVKVNDYLSDSPSFVPLIRGRASYAEAQEYVIEEDGYYALSGRDAASYPNYITTAYVIKKSLVAKVEDLESEVAELRSATSIHDVLFGKKYVACGDSFTAYTNAKFESGIYQGRDKTYPYLIGLRTGMDVNNMAVSGMSLVKKEGSDNYFSGDYFKGIPSDADYITIKLGINDVNYGSPIGTINNSDNTTFYGAWNVVMSYLIANYPYAKIGIIVTNGASDEVMEAERAIAKKWGVPFLDYGDYQTPLMGRMSGFRDGVVSEAMQARHNAFRISDTDTHPNAKAHEYESTFIEAFLRRL